MDTPRNGPRLKYCLYGLVAGVLLVAAAAEAMRYTDARPFCSSCHSMAEAARTHKASPHANLACNECHAPHELVFKLPFKAKEGLRDVISTLQGKDVPLRANPETRDVINANCRACHITTNKDVDVMAAKPYCVDCHRGMAHQKKKPVSTRMVADE